MATSHLDIKDIGQVKLFRRRGLKNIRISINSAGEIRLSLPWYVSKKTGVKYLNQKKDWIKKHAKPTNKQWQDGQRLTKQHFLKVSSHQKQRVNSFLAENTLTILVPGNYTDSATQQAISRCIKKFLKSEGEKVLIPLTKRLANQSKFNVKDIKLKNLKSRWGSCNQEKIITLNLSLLRLPDELIEYVIVHELVHTKHLNHSKQFWSEVETILPEYKDRKNKLKLHSSSGFF